MPRTSACEEVKGALSYALPFLPAWRTYNKVQELNKQIATSNGEQKAELEARKTDLIKKGCNQVFKGCGVLTLMVCALLAAVHGVDTTTLEEMALLGGFAVAAGFGVDRLRVMKREEQGNYVPLEEGNNG